MLRARSDSTRRTPTRPRPYADRHVRSYADTGEAARRQGLRLQPLPRLPAPPRHQRSDRPPRRRLRRAPRPAPVGGRTHRLLDPALQAARTALRPQRTAHDGPAEPRLRPHLLQDRSPLRGVMKPGLRRGDRRGGGRAVRNAGGWRSGTGGTCRRCMTRRASGPRCGSVGPADVAVHQAGRPARDLYRDAPVRPLRGKLTSRPAGWAVGRLRHDDTTVRRSPTGWE